MRRARSDREACAALLHDMVEDHADDIAPSGRQDALEVLAGQFGSRTTDLVPHQETFAPFVHDSGGRTSRCASMCTA